MFVTCAIQYTLTRMFVIFTMHVCNIHYTVSVCNINCLGCNVMPSLKASYFRLPGNTSFINTIQYAGAILLLMTTFKPLLYYCLKDFSPAEARFLVCWFKVQSFCVRKPVLIQFGKIPILHCFKMSDVFGS